MTLRIAVLGLACALAACGGEPAPPGRANDRAAAAEAPPAPPVAAADPSDPNDPALPGIPDLARLARYVFRSMRHHEAVCGFENPFRDTLHFAFMIEVVNGRMTRFALSEVSLEVEGGRRALTGPKRPAAVAAYLACLEPHLKAVVMSPAPADGLYDPAYSFAGRAQGAAAPPG